MSRSGSEIVCEYGRVSSLIMFHLTGFARAHHNQVLPKSHLTHHRNGSERIEFMWQHQRKYNDECNCRSPKSSKFSKVSKISINSPKIEENAPLAVWINKPTECSSHYWVLPDDWHCLSMFKTFQLSLAHIYLTSQMNYLTYQVIYDCPRFLLLFRVLCCSHYGWWYDPIKLIRLRRSEIINF